MTASFYGLTGGELINVYRFDAFTTLHVIGLYVGQVHNINIRIKNRLYRAIDINQWKMHEQIMNRLTDL